ncbi:MAG: hypothetical protein MHM6MM_002678 [Cercozoa sp. M6MM]
MSKLTDELKNGFADIVAKNHWDQAKWVLNAFWNDGLAEEADSVYGYAEKFVELDDAAEDGNELDEFESHRFLEQTDGAITVLALRKKLREIDLDFNGKMALVEFLVFRYNLDVTALVTRPQSSNGAALQEAETRLKKVQEAFAVASQARKASVEAELFAVEKAKEARAEAAAAAEEAEKASAAEAVAKAAADEAQAAEDVAKAAEAEVQQAVDALKAEEDAYNGKIAELEAKSTDSSIGIVTRNRAAAELAQVKSEDPLPLRRAKITQESALKRQRKVTKIASDAADNARSTAQAAGAAAAKSAAAAKQSAAAAAAAEEAASAAKAAAAEAAAKLEAAQNELKEAEAYLEEVKAMPGNAEGTIFILEKQMHEAAKFMPASKAARFLAEKQAEIAAHAS